MTPTDISVVIPVLNEEDEIAMAIESAFAAGAREVIVVDGGSQDRSVRIATESRATKIVRSIPGRGIQLNSGAFVAESEFVLFLHADNRLSESCLKQILQHPDCTWGAFRQRIDSNRLIFRFIEWGNSLRVTWSQKPFGDQAIFVRRSVFKREGGFAEIPLMEDVEFSKRMGKVAKPLLLDGPLSISSRRWQKHGVIRQTLRNWSLQIQFAFGASPEKLKRRYV
ncbi:MAG: TIGR04283 family arsenosugar biosynthesis glycosyltransferase [Rubripirellula sp.]